MSRLHLTSPITYIFLLLAFCLPANGADKFVAVEGVAAVIGGNAAAARDKALDDALRRAVEQAVGTFISTDSMTERYRIIHDKILVQSAGYVKNYRILTEKQQDNLYRIKIHAEVGNTALRNDLQALGLLQVLAEKPKVMVIMEEKVAGMFGTNAWEAIGQAESTLIEELLANGFTVVDAQTVKANIPRDRALRMLSGDNQAAAAAGLQAGAQLVLVGKAMSKNAGGRVMGSSLQSLQAVVQARAIRADDAFVIASRSARAAHAHVDEMQGGTIAIEKASKNLANNLIQDVQQNWRGETYGRSRQVTIALTGLVSYRHLMAVMDFLKKEMQGVKEVHQRSFIIGSAELMVDYTGKANHIAQELSLRKFTGFRLEPLTVTPNRLDVKAVLEKPRNH